MSSAVLPTLPGLTWPVKRSPLWSTRKAQSISGKETRVADFSYPRWQWTLDFAVLRQGTYAGSTSAEYGSLVGFFNARLGGADSFLYNEPSDNQVTTQGVGVGDGSNLSFQLVRSLGGFSEPIYAPDTGQTINVYLDGTLQGTGSYSISTWGAASPGVLTFATAPGAGVVITADFHYFWPVRFDDDTLDFSQFMQMFWECKKVGFTSIK